MGGVYMGGVYMGAWLLCKCGNKNNVTSKDTPYMCTHIYMHTALFLHNITHHLSQPIACIPQ